MEPGNLGRHRAKVGGLLWHPRRCQPSPCSARRRTPPTVTGLQRNQRGPTVGSPGSAHPAEQRACMQKEWRTCADAMEICMRYYLVAADQVASRTQHRACRQPSSPGKDRARLKSVKLSGEASGISLASRENARRNRLLSIAVYRQHPMATAPCRRSPPPARLNAARNTPVLGGQLPDRHPNQHSCTRRIGARSLEPVDHSAFLVCFV
jgi:hypothetical protein